MIRIEWEEDGEMMKNTYKRRIMISILVPSGVFVLMIMMLNALYYSRLSSQIYDDSEIQSSEYVERFERKVVEAIQLFDWSVSNALIQDMDINDFGTVIELQQHLKEIKSVNPVVDNIIIFDKKQDFVVASDTSGFSDVYFNELHDYTGISKHELLLVGQESMTYQFMPLVTVSNHVNQVEKQVMPIIAKRSIGVANQYLIIIEIDTISLIEDIQGQMITDHTSFSIRDLNGGILVASAETAMMDLNQEMVYSAIPDDFHQFESEYNGERYLFTARYGIVAENDVFAIVQTPEGDIRELLLDLSVLVGVIMAITVTICSIVIYIMVRFAYKPVGQLMSFIDSDNEGDKDNNEFRFIYDKINEMLDNSQELGDKVDELMDFTQKEYFIKMMNHPQLRYEEFEKYLQNKAFDADSNYNVVLMEFKYTDKCYEDFSIDELGDIASRTEEVLRFGYGDVTEFFTIQLPNNIFCVIIDEKHLNLARLQEASAAYLKLFTEDREYIEISIGMSNRYVPLTSLGEALREAQLALAKSKVSAYDKIQVFGSVEESKFLLSEADRNQLFKYLNAGDVQKLTDKIESIINTNISYGVSDTQMKQLYIEMMDFAVSRLSVRGVDCRQFNEANDIDIHENYRVIRSSDIFQYVRELLLNAARYMQSQKKDAKVDAIAAFIEANYPSDLSLEILGEAFDMSASAMSQIFKKSFGVSYIKYVTEVRMKKAKELLIETEMNAGEIAERIGYSSRTNFIRVFKKNEGITPTEYRKLNN